MITLHIMQIANGVYLGFCLRQRRRRKQSGAAGIMEHGSTKDQSSASFSFKDEDHTLANALRFSLNQDPRVITCGYSIPHPSEVRVNIRVQTTGDPAREVMKDSCQDLMLTSQIVRSTFDQAVEAFRNKNGKKAE